MVEAQGHTLAFQPGGADRLAALLALIEGAQVSLKMCFYIFTPDASGIDVRRCLTAAARRGVQVSLIVDGFGAQADKAFFAELVEAGGGFCSFSPAVSQRYLIRNHQKLVVVDGRVAMLGGFNIEDSYFAPPDENGWEDLGFTVQGPVVARIGHWFDLLEGWTRSKHAKFAEIRRLVREWECGDGPVKLLIGGPTRGFSTWAEHISRDLDEGTSLDLAMGYFSPPRRLLKPIEAIAAKGRTRIVMAAKSDNGATIGASRALYAGLLAAGARIWEFSPCKLHTKLTVLDDTVYAGSANMDMRSLYINLEIVLQITDRALADRIRAYFDRRLPPSEEITPALHRQRATLWNRLRWRASWFLVAVMDYTVSRGLNLGL
ncbi:MAG: phosphatidylserine/phosphatidylglycerophosphate/cardiolipin synthase family protein [Croceibacterium sp.]